MRGGSKALRAALSAGLVLVSLNPAIAAPAAAPRPVIIAHDGENLQPCTSVATVTGKAAIPIYAGPSQKARKVGTANPGVEISVCDYAQKDRWLGVILPTPGVNCGIAMPLKGPRPYRGKCRSGWIEARLVTFIAG